MAAEDQLKRIDLTAPQDGRIFQQAVHTIGGVIQAGEVLMLVVPDADELIIEAKVAPQDSTRSMSASWRSCSSPPSTGGPRPS